MHTVDVQMPLQEEFLATDPQACCRLLCTWPADARRG